MTRLRLTPLPLVSSHRILLVGKLRFGTFSLSASILERLTVVLDLRS